MMGIPEDLLKIDIEEEIRNLVAQVPCGKVTTYGLVAKALGDVVASRLVGKVMSENDDIVRVPCRRVVQSDGRLGGYTGGGTQAKKRALRAEGIEIVGDRIVDFEKRLFSDFATKHPLRRFRRLQVTHSKRLLLDDDFPANSLIAGVDVAYRGGEAFGALVILDRDGRRPSVRDVVTHRMRVSFPYIPTYLTFREFPVISRLLERVDEKIVLAIDGNGILHPLGFGVASHIGVLLDVPTVGIAKKLLCGKVVGTGESRRVVTDGGAVGFAVSGDDWSAPVYVSPGHRVSVRSSRSLLMPYWKHRVPEPIRRAHIEAVRLRGGA